MISESDVADFVLALEAAGAKFSLTARGFFRLDLDGVTSIRNRAEAAIIAGAALAMGPAIRAILRERVRH